ncbi:adenylate/guanylate cyclase domain-containing protein [Burkholderiaceae bacterium FT117]|uniref:CHASE2 domain-containing protein n=1 Tax=Zeimonas sediminis TaxID=2944268 RepID=UPI002342F5B7|nr:adenylate/guanylate cyclase domain-containing protein [Zeimonas sediminis]MCM5572405.1 adenylate/guanylate cyclase domain-containing protein [Zeimonas sediminis]
MTALRRIRLLRALNGLAYVLLLAAHDAGVQPVSMLTGIDRHVYDSRQQAASPKQDPRIVIVDIDERSLAERGRWPWPRETVAALNDAIFERGKPAVVGYDILFGEPQRDGGAGDAAFARSLAGRPTVLGYYLTSDRSGRASGMLPAPVFGRGAVAETGLLDLIDADGYGSNLPLLARAAAAQGFFNPFIGAGIDVDGTIRALPMLASYGEVVHESFALAVLRQYLGAGAVIVDGDLLRLAGERGDVSIPVSVGYTAMVPFAGRGGASGGRFRYVSAADVLDGRVDWSVMRDRIVLVGTSAPGLTDLRATPVNEVFPGVEIHASLLAGALDDAVPRRPLEAGIGAALVTLLVGGTLAVLLPMLGPIGTVAASGAALVLVVGGNSAAYWTLGLVLPLAGPMVAILVLAVFNLLLGYMAEGRARRAVVRLFGEYLSPTLVEQMARDPVRWRAGEIENREITILFADIRGFTRMAESMEPAALREYLNTVLTAMTDVVHEHGGTVDKYIGDAVMAFWGAPMEDPNHAEHAVAAAQAMQEAARRLSADFIMRGLPALSIGVGVNTGFAQVGDMGSAARRTYTAIGDAVNLASRLETLTKHHEVPIIVGEATARACTGRRFAELGPVRIQGRSDAVRLFVPLPAGRSGVRADAPALVQPEAGRLEGAADLAGDSPAWPETAAGVEPPPIRAGRTESAPLAQADR